MNNAEQIRRQFLNHEASIRSFGFLYLLNGCVGLAGTAVMYFTLFLGRGMRALDSKVKTGVTILAGIGLIGFPLGTLINDYILYLIHGAKGKRVMSAEYQSVVAQTPHIQYKMSLIVKVFLVLILALVILGVAVAIFEA